MRLSQFALNLHAALNRRKWSTGDFARRLPLEWALTDASARRKVRRYLNGQSAKIHTVILFAEILEVDPAELAFSPAFHLKEGEE